METKQKNLTLVLNGGSTEMDSATIPIKWFFSEELAKKEPKYLVICEQTEKETKSRWSGDESFLYNGRRYVVSVEDAVTFLQLFNSGVHRITAMAFSEKSDAMDHLSKGDSRPYEHAMYSESIDKKWNHSLAGTVVEFSVPEELFAQPPSTKLGKLWWYYLFWPVKPKPKDECSTRKVLLLFALLKLPFFILWKIIGSIWFLVHVTAFVFYLLHMLVTPVIVFFFGFWPINFKKWKESIKNTAGNIGWISDPTEGYHSNISANGEKTTFLTIYNKQGKPTEKRMWVSPFWIVSIIASVFFFAQNISHCFSNQTSFGLVFASICFFTIFVSCVLQRNSKEDVSTFVVIFLALALSFIISLNYWSIFHAKMEKIHSFPLLVLIIIMGGILLGGIVIFIKELLLPSKFFTALKKKFSWLNFPWLKRKTSMKLEYSAYLLENFTKPEEKVNLKNLPRTFDKNNLARGVRIIFWTAKRKVCRPYEYAK